MAAGRMGYAAFRTPEVVARGRMGYAALRTPSAAGNMRGRMGYAALHISEKPKPFLVWSGTRFLPARVYVWTGNVFVEVVK